jgi:5-methylcytosine-specific restriction endonuclease McrA
MKRKLNFDHEIVAEEHNDPRESEVTRPLDFSDGACAAEELAYRTYEVDANGEDRLRQTNYEAFMGERSRRARMRDRARRRSKEHPLRTTRLVVGQNIRAQDTERPGVLKVEQWEAWRWCFSGECAYCGGKPDYECIEHVVPLSRGGENTIYNVVPSCQRCNQAKGIKDAIRWMTRTARLSGFMERIAVALERMNEKTSP